MWLLFVFVHITFHTGRDSAFGQLSFDSQTLSPFPWIILVKYFDDAIQATLFSMGRMSELFYLPTKKTQLRTCEITQGGRQTYY